MNLIFCGHTATQICARIAKSGIRIARPSRVQTLDGVAATIHDIQSLNLAPLLNMLSRNATAPRNLSVPTQISAALEYGPDAVLEEAARNAKLPPLEILVGHDASRNRSSMIKQHIWSSPIPKGSLYQIGPGIYVTCPEYSLLLNAKGHSFNSLLALAYELCGSYAIDMGENGSFGHPPLTHPERISAFLDQVEGKYGSGRIRDVLPYVKENSRSPMETALGIAMSLPVRLGGYGLAELELNHLVDFDETERRMSGLDYALIDFYFDSAHLGLEYNSNLEHTGPDRIARDSRRNNTLRHKGYKLRTITWDQAKTPERFDDIMMQTYKVLGLRWRPPGESSLIKRRQIWCDLIPAYSIGKL